ncbi:rRNA maturation RNase YbeY [bacterium]|nr:rRNA maturation RNase YbeY [bacterium]
MIGIDNTNPELTPVDEVLLQMAVERTLLVLKQPNMDITLRLTDDEEMRRLNQTFRGEDKTTDVLSFNQDVLDPETGRTYLGDIVISLPQAEKQAGAQGHSLSAESAFLAIHGTLHLLGYDHYDPAEKEAMWVLQDQIFADISNTKGES